MREERKGGEGRKKNDRSHSLFLKVKKEKNQITEEGGKKGLSGSFLFFFWRKE